VLTVHVYAILSMFWDIFLSKAQLNVIASEAKTRNVLKKTISEVCKGHLDLFLIRFVQVNMTLKALHHLESRDA